MKLYNVPVCSMIESVVIVEAESVDEAIQKAKRGDWVDCEDFAYIGTEVIDVPEEVSK